jgi:hypothetical protein
MKATFRYFHVKSVDPAYVFEFVSLAELYRYAIAKHVKDVFILADANVAPVFCLLNDQGILQHSTMGFATLEDYATATNNGFTNADVYYTAKQQGYTNVADYNLRLDANIGDKESFDAMRSGGFEAGYQQMVSMQTALPIGVHDAYSLYTKALAEGFTTYDSYALAASKGFTNQHTFTAATAAGYPTAADYQEGLDKLFTGYHQLQEARERGFRNMDDMNKCRDLDMMDCVGCSSDERILVSLLSKVKESSLIPIDKIQGGLTRAIDTYRYADTQQLPSWLTLSLTGTDTLVNFLCSSNAVKQFGNYIDIEAAYKVNRLKDRQVAIDGYATLHGTVKDSTPVPDLLLKIAVHLRSKGYERLVLVGKSSHMGILADPQKGEQLLALATLIELPDGIAGLKFQVDFIKRTLCKVVTDSTFAGTRATDKWVAENIDYYKVPFLIKDDEVEVPDLV